MSSFVADLETLPVREFAAGETVIGQGECTGLLYFLIAGNVAVTKDGVTVTQTNEAGAVFGDLSALLGVPHTAEVHALDDSSFHVASDPVAFLESHPQVNLHLCRLLARRLDGVNRYLVDLKHQFEGHDHLGMVDGMLDLLMHRHPRERVKARCSSESDAELAD